LNQSFTNFELIIVNDGSTDGSDKICDDYSEADDRIHVIHKENGGVSSARNRGLDIASGEWIYFVDSDDELLPDGLQSLINCISDEVDIVMGGYEEEREDGSILTIPDRVVLSLSKKQSILSLFIGYGSFYYSCGYLWIRLFRRMVIQRFNLLFDTSIAIKEDTLFIAQYVCKSNGITMQTTTPVYRYIRRGNSAMGKVLNGYEPKYIDSFYALVKIKHEIELVFPSHSVPIFVAKQAIFGRYYSIIKMMDDYDVCDDELKRNLYLIMRNEMGSVFLFKVRRKVRKIFSFVNLL
jgi:glycosyltransferase EpsH